MKKKLLIGSFALAALAAVVFAAVSWNRAYEVTREDKENEMYDGPDLAARAEFYKTVDLSLGDVPRERLLSAIDAAEESKAEARQAILNRQNKGRKDSPAAPQLLSWVERGSNTDSAGPAGNARGPVGSGPWVTSGRMRAILVDLNDPTNKTVFVGGVAGGVWKTSDITAAPATWTPVSDQLSNLAVADIAQDPRAGFQNIMYFATGESYFNADAVRGNGVFKSTDGGTTWSYLASSSAFQNGTRIIVDGSGNVYVATGSGLFRSADGGTTWSANISPSGLSTSVCDLELSSTGRLHVVTGIFSAQGYRYTDTPSTVTTGTWTTPVTTFVIGASMRAEIAVSGDTLYAAPANGSYQVPTMYRSTDGGANWVATTTQPGAGAWGAGQAWYNLNVVINPANPLEVVVGAVDAYRSLDGGIIWTRISAWTTSVAPTLPYVHADHHEGVWFEGGNKLLLGTDGGIFYSTDKGTTFSDRNVGLRLKQFYSVAIHPTLTNYFLAGAQDNGTHSFSNAGLSGSVEVTGGDGAFVAIDQDTPANQFGAYVYNQYRFSTNSGTSWSNRNFSSSAGRFINPFELDSTANIVYAAHNAGSFTRWPSAPTGASLSAIAVSNMTSQVSAIAVSPYTANQVLLGTGTIESTGSTSGAGKIFRVDNANTFASGSAAVEISTGLPAGAYISNIAYGTDDNNLIASVSNYGSPHVLVTTNGGTTWTNVSGNLPDMPVRWAIFKPGTNLGAVIGTEAGVWETDAINTAGVTTWTADPTFPATRVDMIRYRASDTLYAAATHGRGLWTTTVATAANVSVSGRVLTSEGRGLRNGVVTIIDQSGNARNVVTGALGTYRFDDLATGATYVISVNSRRFSYEPRVVVLTDEITGFDITPVSNTGRRVESSIALQPVKPVDNTKRR